MSLIICLFDLILNVPSTIFQLYRDGSSWVEPVPGFFWPVLTTDIRSCSQCQKVCFFPNLNKKIPNSRNKKTGEKITKYRHFTMFMFVVERAGPNSPNDTREITKYCKLPNGNVPLRQFSRIYSRRCRGVCNIINTHGLFYWYPTLAY